MCTTRVARSGQRPFNLGLSQRSRGGPALVSPRSRVTVSPAIRAVKAASGGGTSAIPHACSRPAERAGGGPSGTRTRDPRLAKAVLSQLSYRPPTPNVSDPRPGALGGSQRSHSARADEETRLWWLAAIHNRVGRAPRLRTADVPGRASVCPTRPTGLAQRASNPAGTELA